MSLSRWKVLACTLTVGVGGLAVFATDPIPAKTEPAKEPAPLPNLTVKPATPPGGSDTPPPIVPVKGEEFELTIPIPPPGPAKVEEPKKADAAPVFEPITPAVPPLVIPVKGEVEAKDAKKPEPPKVTPPPVPELKPPVKEEPKPPEVLLPPIDEKKKPADAPKPSAPKPPAVDVKIPDIKPAPDPTPAPPVKVETPPLKLTPEPAKRPETTPTPPPPRGSIKLTPTKPAEGAKLKLTLRMGDGEPRFEIRNAATTELLLKVYGQKIEMKPQSDSNSSLAGVTALGKVRFTAPGIEGTCDHLTIMSGTGELLLEKDIRLKTKHGKAWSEISADRMVYQIGTNGLTAPVTPRVTSASYIGE